MRRTRFSLVAVVAAFALVAAACGGGGGDEGPDAGGEPKDCTWVIGTIGALSGDYASVGQPIADGVEYAVNQANEEGSLACNLEFTSEDSQGDPNQAPALAQKLVQNQELVFVGGPYFSGETLATGKIFGKAGVAISGTGTNETIDEQGYTTWFRAVAPSTRSASTPFRWFSVIAASCKGIRRSPASASAASFVSTNPVALRIASVSNSRASAR